MPWFYNYAAYSAINVQCGSDVPLLLVLSFLSSKVQTVMSALPTFLGCLRLKLLMEI